MMRVQARLFATLRSHLPPDADGNSVELGLPDGATLEDLLGKLNVPPDEVRVTMVNGRARPRDWALESGDEVGIFPPIGGG
jgi:sulfur-carrier protein